MDQDQILEIAKQLGDALKNSMEYRLFVKNRDEMRANADLKAKLDEFKVQKTLLDIESEKEEKDDHVIDIVNERVEKLYKEIMEFPEMIAYQKSEDDLNLLMNAVNMTISSFIGAEEYAANLAAEAGECTHDCSHCHAACASNKEE